MDDVGFVVAFPEEEGGKLLFSREEEDATRLPRVVLTEASSLRDGGDSGVAEDCCWILPLRRVD